MLSASTSTVRDPTGACCERKILDGAGRCCTGAVVDVCGVCGGSNSTCRLSLSLELDWAALGLETDEEVCGRVIVFVVNVSIIFRHWQVNFYIFFTQL